MSPPGSRSGLTIVEVMAIIIVVAILMGLLFPAGSAFIPARRAQAANDLSQLVVAMKAFYADYGVYPVAPGRTGQLVYGCPGNTRHNSEVVNILRGDTADGPVPSRVNTRQVIYLDVPRIKQLSHPRSGLGTGKEANSNGITAAGEWYDPWGSPYLVFINATGTNGCDLGLVYSDLVHPSNDPAHPASNVDAATLGTDRQIGRAGNNFFAGSDDIIASRR